QVSVPAFVYMIQNNLLYVATSNLDAATCQVTYQFKILTTALFTVTMLNRTILPLKWLSLVILVIGIALVQLPNIGAGSAFNIAASGNPALGLSAVVAACFMSGFAGVYFEKMLKGTPTSVWMRNIQMGTIGGILALAAVFIKDGQAVLSAGFFQGWNLFVWDVQLGGLILPLVVRYPNNILKGFATSL
ncbi:hypothetical protein GUITHDRAFT_42006, partial [Guillardia theta CCMP2712]